LSAVAALSASPAVLSPRELSFILNHVRGGFVDFTRYHDVSQVLAEVDDVIVLVPFARSDGLNASIDGIVEGMRPKIAAHVYGAIRAAYLEVAAVTVADLKARIRAGDVVIR
jgi:hypothetical protein